MGLLALKLLAWMGEPYPGKVPSSGAAFTSATPAGKPEVLSVAKVTARANAPDVLLDPETTGSVDKPAPKSPESLRAEAEAKAAAERAADPRNKAAILNGAAGSASPSERAILERLSERREEIEARMRELEMRERLLDSAEKKLDGRVGDLKALEDKIEGPQGKPGEEESKAIKTSSSCMRR